jgi:E3 ubiquitin-protein ligase UHRF1
MASQLRINSALVEVIWMAKTSKNSNSAGSAAVHHYIRNDQRPDKAFTTDRAKKTGKANASSGQIFVTIGPDHFGPILAENDPKRNVVFKLGKPGKTDLSADNGVLISLMLLVLLASPTMVLNL